MATRGSDTPTDMRSIPTAEQGPLIPGAERMPPPIELLEAERKIWRDITGRLPPEWFTADNSPLLKELCRHIAYADELAVDMQALRVKKAEVARGSGSVKARTAAVAALTADLHVLLRLHGYQSERIGNLATKLRLTNQSRWQATTADDQRMRAATGPKPWEAWSQ